MAETFNPYKEQLPIVDVFDEIKNTFNTKTRIVLSAPPGAGKSTLIPLALIQEKWLGGKKILMLEPRRLAAKGIAERMASLLNEKVGETVGYRVRFDTKISNQTKIEIITEGILSRMLQNDNTLENVGLIIFDEFHERSIHTDTTLAFAREIQTILRTDLRLLVMSATLDSTALSKLLEAPIIKSSGRQFPVEHIYAGETDQYLLAESATAVALKAVKAHEGDILIFLPGEREITICANNLRAKTENIKIHGLYGRLPQSKQHAAILPNREGKRKIVISTAIAETSLTIEGVKIVIDSGHSRIAHFDTKTGLTHLKTIPVTKDIADQRAGRAGRIEPGVCYRLWTKAAHSKLKEHRIPEILEADLTSLTLDLYKWGINDATQLQWVDSPPNNSIAQAKENLYGLKAIENGKITPHGVKMQQVPVHPRIAHMLLIAEEEGLLELATDVAAILESRDPLPKESGIDITLRVEALRRYRKQKNEGGKFKQIEKIAAQYRKLFKVDSSNSVFDPYEVGLLIIHAYPERIAFARPGNNAQFQLSNGKYAMAGHKDDLAHESWLAIAHLNANGNVGRIFLAAPLNPKDLAPFVSEHEVTRWNTKKGGLIAAKEVRIGNIILKSTPLDNPDEGKLIEAISEAIRKEGEALLDFNEDVKQWQNRVNTIRKWYPNENWPNTSTSYLLETNALWISPYLIDVKKPEDLKKIDLKTVLEYSLGNKQRERLNALVPQKIVVPSGSHIKLNYQHNGSSPILAVRIQEIFGLLETPLINEGKISVLMHLLSPGYKPVQITDDLKNFWQNTYFEVRKELRIRYKKHAWPEDPINEKAIRGSKKK